MMIEVRYYTIAHAITKKRAEKIRTEGSTMRSLLEKLVEKYEDFEKIVYDPHNREIKPFCRVILRGTTIKSDALEIKLHDGDTVSIIQAVAGG